MEIKVVKEPIKREEILSLAKERFGDLVKAVIDTEKEIMAIGGEMHADEEVVLIEKEGSIRENTWGINIYPEKKENWIEFDSIINLKPSFGNRTSGIENEEIKKRIIAIVEKLIV